MLFKLHKIKYIFPMIQSFNSLQIVEEEPERDFQLSVARSGDLSP